MLARKSEPIRLILLFAFFSALLRIAGTVLPFSPLGFSPMESIALFSSRFIRLKWLAYLFPLLLTMSTDSFLNYYFTRNWNPFYLGFYWQMLAFLMITWLGPRFLCREKYSAIFLGSFSAATVFFIISNFGVWLSTSLYSFDFQGLISCYRMAFPFYAKDIAATVFFSSVIYFTQSHEHHHLHGQMKSFPQRRECRETE